MATASLSATASLLTTSLLAIALISTSNGVGANASLVATGVLSPSSAFVRVSQAGVEALVKNSPNVYVTQAGVETIVRTDPSIRVSQSGVEVLLSNATFARPPIPATAKFGLTRTGTVPAQAYLGGKPRTVPSIAKLLANPARLVFSTAEIGYRRYVPSTAWFLGFPRRSVFSTTRFRVPGEIPSSASFWANVPTWRVISSSRTKVMALASHLVGGNVGNYLGIVPAANNAPAPSGWENVNYDDSFWPYAISHPGGLIPYPFPDPTINSIDFDWRWPNNTGDYSPSYSSSPPPTADPCFAVNIFRHAFGLPLDPSVAAATSGNIYVGVSSGVFIAQVFSVKINGIPLPYFGNNLNNPSANVNIWTVPSSVLRPGKNVISFGTSVYLCFGIFGDSAQFELNLTYRPPLIGMAQVIS